MRTGDGKSPGNPEGINEQNEESHALVPGGHDPYHDRVLYFWRVHPVAAHLAGQPWFGGLL